MPNTIRAACELVLLVVPHERHILPVVWVYHELQVRLAQVHLTVDGLASEAREHVVDLGHDELVVQRLPTVVETRVDAHANGRHVAEFVSLWGDEERVVEAVEANGQLDLALSPPARDHLLHEGNKCICDLVLCFEQLRLVFEWDGQPDDGGWVRAEAFHSCRVRFEQRFHLL